MTIGKTRLRRTPHLCPRRMRQHRRALVCQWRETYMYLIPLHRLAVEWTKTDGIEHSGGAPVGDENGPTHAREPRTSPHVVAAELRHRPDRRDTRDAPCEGRPRIRGDGEVIRISDRTGRLSHVRRPERLDGSQNGLTFAPWLPQRDAERERGRAQCAVGRDRDELAWWPPAASVVGRSLCTEDGGGRVIRVAR